MLGEFDWDHLHELIDAFSVASVYGSNVKDLELKILEVFEDAAGAPPTMDDFTTLLDTSIRSKEAVSRKVAWVAQHCLGSRAWCVGQKIFLGRNPVSSPLVQQVKRLHIEPRGIDLGYWQNFSARQGFEVQTKVDAILVDIPNNTIFIVKGCSYTQARQQSPRLVLHSGGDSLFGPKDRVLANLEAPNGAVAALITAYAVMQASFAHMSVRPIYLVVDDPDCGWHFQAHDLGDVCMRDLKSGPLCLDEVPIVCSSLSERGPSLVHLPKWHEADFLSKSPVDRPSRALMLLQAIWERQLQNDGELIPASATDLAADVQARYSVEYPVDLRRHDLEDCLRAGGLIRRTRYAENSYAITPTGIGRYFIMKKKFFGRANPDLGLTAIRRMSHQSSLWAKYQRGSTT